MSDVVSLTERKWNSNSAVDAHTVLDMLRVAIAQIERGEIEASHAILCLGHVTDENGASTDWLQAGKFDAFRQLGLLERVKMAIIDSGVSGA